MTLFDWGIFVYSELNLVSLSLNVKCTDNLTVSSVTENAFNLAMFIVESSKV